MAAGGLDRLHQRLDAEALAEVERLLPQTGDGLGIACHLDRLQVIEADLLDNSDDMLREAQTVARNVPVFPISAVTGQGLSALDPYLKAGETVAVIGSSGVGKSTLINLLAGLDSPTSGEICIEGELVDCSDLDVFASLRLNKIGVVFQDHHLLEELLVRENVSLPLELLQ